MEVATLRKYFPGIDEDGGGEFRAHLELAALAIALKRRVIVLQSVEHAQMDDGPNAFKSFVRALNADSQRVDDLEAGIAQLLRRLSTLELTRPHRWRDLVLTSREVEQLLQTAYRLRDLGDGLETTSSSADIAIDIARSADGSVVVFPAVAV